MTTKELKRLEKELDAKLDRLSSLAKELMAVGLKKVRARGGGVWISQEDAEAVVKALAESQGRYPEWGSSHTVYCPEER